MKSSAIVFYIYFFMSAAMASPINKVVIFGDSLSDTGNLYEQMYRRFPASPPYYEGRFSNGPLWIEHVITHYYPNDSQPSSGQYPNDSLAHLSNYAIAGTGVEDESEEDEDDDFMSGLNAQIKAYLQLFDEQVDESALHIVWSGSNNYLGMLEDREGASDETILGIKRGIDKLIKKGAKHIMLLNLPDLGLSPVAREKDMVEMLSYVSRQHNEKLLAVAQTFQEDYPDVQWLYFDVSQRFLNVVTYPEDYGFKNVMDACQKAEDDLSQCDTYLFFDSGHLSGHAHQVIAQHVIAYLEQSGVQFEQD